MKEFKCLSSEGLINGKRTKNRSYLSAMGTNFAEPDGSLGDKAVSYYEKRARGGAAIIVPGVVCVEYPRGKTITNQVRLDDIKYAKGVQNLSEAVHRHDSLLLLQLHHVGRQTERKATEGVIPIGPSPAVDLMGEPCDVFTTEGVKDLIGKFVDAAMFAKIGHADGVMLHAAHGYLLSQFLSPVFNQRTDEYGGSEENRRRVVIEIINKIKEVCGSDFIVGVRMGAFETCDGGFELEEGKRIAKAFEAAGADCLDISYGVSGDSHANVVIPTQKIEDGFRIDFGRAIKSVVNIPVMQAGKLRDPEVCERFLMEGSLDYVGLAR